ncbi:hypothetical protein Kpol_1039p12 [Vanderwaltozyma polyspora DSM 70294]|uniref:MMS19 nucleotide excision repair protein n=1 Tax=Vanderwaltozyma polyspora (strain ATCC 22028 / DSM 70294 / BCRC 21397 / CBS 2163 / NBRC 10782 / NRRL Y-8283 / UCD 57-17) TaxID=436907 RepID=A7THD9_VANPO|nr:uncharacterized protein Kpol_1039p12 [Vanderwaltozyma polyspora DSM 70294]EDO18263.1 hypothetical protein Kpol_1039p12 [Vanderwaltozyma polyspora DSM 70294]
MQLDSVLTSYIANLGNNDAKAEEISSDIAKSINSKEIKLIAVIMALKDGFTSEEESSRKNSLRCLSDILERLDKELLSPNEVPVIFEFYKSKFEDDALMNDVLGGFDSLISMKNSSIDMSKDILGLISEKYSNDKYLAAIRYKTFKILEDIYTKFGEKYTNNIELTKLYINCFLHIASGEKDPRNLIISFRLNKIITTSFNNIDEFKEDLFDVLFCYFPISFTPPKNDPYNISSEELKFSLRSSIAATPLFAEDAFGNLIDKLTATSPNVKCDTLQTLSACIDNFGGKLCLQEWLPIWNALKFELMHNSEGGDVGVVLPNQINEDIRSSDNPYILALSVIKSLSSALLNFEISAFEKFYKHIFEELKPNFSNNKDLKQSCTILAAIASTSQEAFNPVIKSVLPLFLTNTSEVSKLKLILMNLSFFFDSYISVYGSSNLKTIEEKVAENSLEPYRDELLMILSKALTGSSDAEVTLRTLAVIQFTKLVKMKGYLTSEEVSLIVQYLTETILTDGNKNIYYASLEGLKVISEFYENIVFEVSLKRMLTLLPDNPSDTITIGSDKLVSKEIICKVILDYTNSRHILVKESICYITDKICNISTKEGTKDYSFLLISTLYSLYENNTTIITEDDADFIKAHTQDSVFKSILQNKSIYEDDLNFSLLSTICFFMQLKCSRKLHQSDFLKYNTLLIEEYQILEKPSRYMILYSKLLSSLDKKIEFHDSTIYFETTAKLLSSRYDEFTDFEKLGYLEFLMVLSNKWIDESFINDFIRWDNSEIPNLEINIWITKGLIMKNSKIAPEYLRRFIELLSDKKIGSFVAKLFEIFVVDIDSFKTYKNVSWSNNIKVLYKQKFFNDVFHVLLGEFKKQSDISLKSNYLTALSLILKHISNTLVEPFLRELIPLILEALDMPNSEVKISALETLIHSSEKNGVLITEYFNSILPLTLKLLNKHSSNIAKVRLLALELLQILAATVPLNYSIAVKDEVLRSLVPILDDPKRIVRRQCVNARQKFYELGQPTVQH